MDGSIILYQKITRFSLGSLDFRLKYENQQTADYAMYLVSKRLLHLHGLIDLSPTDGSAVVYGTISNGQFGTIAAGVDTSTGEARAVK